MQIHIVASLNAHRRHLTAEDRRKRIEALVAADPAKSDRAIAKAAKVDHKTVAAVRANKEATGEIPQLTARTGADGKDGIQVRELREVMLQDALTELQHVQRKYESVVELAGVWAKVDRARRKTVSGKARKEERAGAA